MIENISLVVTQVTDGIFSEMRIIERQYFQIWQSIKIQNFLEAAYFISADIEIVETN